MLHLRAQCLSSVSDSKYVCLYLGTGKTATFAIGILQQLDISLRRCQALVLAPTRELAQVSAICVSFSWLVPTNVMLHIYSKS